MQISAAPLTHARIAKFYVPLALSWVFMALESPICVSVVSRLPHPGSPEAKLNTAAFLVLMSIALFIETPVIDLLSTSTTLSKNHKDFALVSRFVWYLMIATAVVHAFVVLTPVYWTVTLGILKLKPEVASAARTGLAMMILWSPSIGWRRYRQGLLIRSHRTRMVGYGTAVRVGTVAIVNMALYFLSNLPGIQIVAIALTSSVFAEAVFIHLASIRVVRENLSSSPSQTIEDQTEEAPGAPLELSDAIAPVGMLEIEDTTSENKTAKQQGLTMSRLIMFHTPLSLTTMVTLLGLPIVSRFLSMSNDPVLSLAAWQVAFSVLWLFRTITFALPEVVITLFKDEESAKKLRDFCMRIGLATSVVALAAAATRLDVWIFREVLDAAPDTADLAHIAFLAAAPLGFINAMQSYVRGMLTAHHLNVARFAAVIVGMGALVLGLWLGLYTPWRGVLASAMAFNFALIAELAVLVFSWRTGRRSLAAESATA